MDVARVSVLSAFVYSLAYPPHLTRLGTDDGLAALLNS